MTHALVPVNVPHSLLIDASRNKLIADSFIDGTELPRVDGNILYRLVNQKGELSVPRRKNPYFRIAFRSMSRSAGRDTRSVRDPWRTF